MLGLAVLSGLTCAGSAGYGVNVSDAPEKRTKSETRVARQLYLYGDGDGKRVVSVQLLREKTGLSEATLRRRLPEWEREAEEILTANSEGAFRIRLTADEIAFHKANISFLEAQIKECKFELDNLSDITERLMRLTEKFSDDPDMRMEALQLFNSWVQSCGKRSTLRASFLAMQKQHATLTGIVGKIDAAIAYDKTLQTGLAKKAVASDPGDPGKSSSPGAGFFRKPDALTDSNRSSETGADAEV